MTGALLLLAAAVTAMAAPTANQAVLVLSDGRCRPAAAEELVSELPADVHHAWVWSSLTPPRRVRPAEWRRPASSAGHTSLAVSVAGVRSAAGLRLVAAPVAMWQDVPEELLPSFPFAERPTMLVPHDPQTAWRLHLIGDRQGSAWQDLTAGETKVVLRPERAAPLVLVVDGPAGRLEQAVVRVFPAAERRGMGAPSPIAWFVAAGGGLRVEGLPVDSPVSLLVQGAGLAPALVEGHPTALPRTVRLGQGTALKGRVVDGSGKPIAGAEIRVDFWAAPTLPWSIGQRTRSGDDGRWQAVGIPDGEVALTVTDRGYAPFSRSVHAVGEEADLGDVVLRPGIELPVIVRNDVGQPVSGAVVDAGPGVRAVTDDRGTARLVDMPIGPDVTVRVNASGHLEETIELGAAVPEQLHVALTRAFRLRARFLAADRVPVEQGEARVETRDSYQVIQLGADGQVDAELPPDVPFTLVLRASVTPEVRVEVGAGAPGESRDLGDITAPRGMVVVGTVVSALDGAPIAGARVWTTRPSPQGPLIAWMQKDLLQAASGEDGRFSLAGLPHAAGVLRVDAPGFARAFAGVEPPTEGDQVEVGAVVLSEGATVRVVIEGAAAERATALLDLRGEGLPADMVTAQVHDDAGVFSHVPPGLHQLKVTRGAKYLCERQVEISERDRMVVVRCDVHDVEIAGRVLAGGRPVGPGTLVWQSGEGGRLPEGIMTHTTATGLRQQSTITTGRPPVQVNVAPDGCFRTFDVSPGPWLVDWYPDSGPPSSRLEVRVPEVDRYEVDLQYPSLSISGVVVDAQGEVVRMARVRELTTMALTFTTADGRFALGGLRPGPIRLQARAGELESDILELRLAEDRRADDVRLMLRESDAGVLTVTVLDTDGRPAVAALVFLETDGELALVSSADASGRIRFVLPSPPPARVRAAALAGQVWVLGGWTTLDEARAGLELAAVATGSLVVHTESSGGFPTIEAPGGWNLSWLLTRVGLRPSVSPETPLRLSGLPTGTYTVRLRTAVASGTVRPDRESSVKLE